MKIRTIDNGDLEIILQGNLKSPFPKLNRKIEIDGDAADINAVTATVTCEQGGKVYKGYHIYLLREV